MITNKCTQFMEFLEQATADDLDRAIRIASLKKSIFTLSDSKDVGDHCLAETAAILIKNHVDRWKNKLEGAEK